VCQAIYKSEFLPENTIGIVDEAQVDTYSLKAMKWLEFIAQKVKAHIRHACNVNEQVIRVNGKCLYKVDGYCKETNTIYQFHGCYWHGCKKCYDELTVNRFSQYNIKHLHKRTTATEEFVKSSGYNLVTIWEHKFDKNKKMKSIKLDVVKPSKIRDDGFHRERCKSIKLIYNFKNKELKGKYINVVSLYPTVMYYDKYPTDYPERISKPEQYDMSWFEFVYCKILAARGLCLLILPYKQKTKQAMKLLFGLCRTCMAQMDAKCTHFNTNAIRAVQ